MHLIILELISILEQINLWEYKTIFEKQMPYIDWSL